MTAHNLKDLTGQRFDRLGLTVLGKGVVRQKTLFWKCLKDDGTEVERPGYHLRTYQPRPDRPKRPPASKKPSTAEYTAWTSMKQIQEGV